MQLCVNMRALHNVHPITTGTVWRVVFHGGSWTMKYGTNIVHFGGEAEWVICDNTAQDQTSGYEASDTASGLLKASLYVVLCSNTKETFFLKNLVAPSIPD